MSYSALKNVFGRNGMEIFHLLQSIKYLFSETEAFYHIDAKSWKSSIAKKHSFSQILQYFWHPRDRYLRKNV